MCGIAGFYSFRIDQSVDNRRQIMRRMTDSIHHRGPDGGHSWVDKNSGIALGQRRLAIIDLSDAGLQPMESFSGRYVITFNGEIYNFQLLRRDLEGQGISFKGRSDTEVLLSAIEHWGLNAALQKINGMFAFALWDKQEKRLHFVRDRFGKKPLYIGWVGKDIVFASELKAFHQYSDFKPTINETGFQLYKQYGYLHAPFTIFENVWQLEPASHLSIDVENIDQGSDLSRLMTSYWSLKRVAEDGRQNLLTQSDDDVVRTFTDKLRTTVTQRMISDVPLGAFLSGGLDSSTVVSVMQEISSSPVKTFTIGFEEEAYNEAGYARDVAHYLGTDHEEFILDLRKAMDVIPQLSDMYDEPFADSSQIPTYLVSKMARQHVTVALSGDGGDEILAGYDRHVKVAPIWEKIKYLPSPLRKVVFSLLEKVPDSFYQVGHSNNPYFAARVKRSLKLLQKKDIEALYDALLSMNNSPVSLSTTQWPDKLNALNTMLFGDMKVYRPHDLMVKADRASMAASLEVRAPLMDYQLAEYCWTLPDHMKIRNGKGKWLLRQVLKNYLPQELIDRPKMGFSVPLDQWLKSDLYDWADDLLTETSLQQSGYGNAGAIRNQWMAFNDKGAVQEVPKDLWSVLMFQSWYQRWMRE